MNPQMIQFRHVSKTPSDPIMKTLPNKICRICFEAESTEDPIITPCSCRGSMQHIHEKCLKSWILSQNADPQTFNCDVCKSPVKMEITLKRTCTCTRFRNEMIKILVVQSLIAMATSLIIFLLVFLVNDSATPAISGKIYVAVAILVCLCIDLAMIVILWRIIKRNCLSQTVKSWKIFSRAVTVVPEVTQITEFVDRKKNRTKSSLVENIGAVKEESFMINTYKTGVSFTQRHRYQNFLKSNCFTPRAAACLTHAEGTLLVIMEEVVLYYDITSQPARAVMIYLDICKVPHKKVPIRITKGEHLTEAFKKVSPSQTIPTLVHKTLVLYESHAIMAYISTVFNPRSSWYPEDPVLRAQVDCYLHWHHLHVRLGCALFLHNKYLAPLIYGRPLPDIEMLTTEAREDSFRMLQSILTEFPYVGRTTEPSIADLACYSELVSLKWVGFDFSAFGRIDDWMKRLCKIAEISKYDKELFKFTSRIKL